MKLTIKNQVPAAVSTREVRKIALRVLKDRDVAPQNVHVVIGRTRKLFSKASAESSVETHVSTVVGGRTVRHKRTLPGWTLTIRLPAKCAFATYHVTRHIAWLAVWIATKDRRARDAAFVRRLAGVGGDATRPAPAPRPRVNRKDWDSAIAAVTRRVCAQLELATPERFRTEIPVPTGVVNEAATIQQYATTLRTADAARRNRGDSHLSDDDEAALEAIYERLSDHDKRDIAFKAPELIIELYAHGHMPDPLPPGSYTGTVDAVVVDKNGNVVATVDLDNGQKIQLSPGGGS